MQFLSEDLLNKKKQIMLQYSNDRQIRDNKLLEAIINSLPDALIWLILKKISSNARQGFLKNYDIKYIDFDILKRAFQHYQCQFDFTFDDDGNPSTDEKFTPHDPATLYILLDIIDVWRGKKPDHYKPSPYQPNNLPIGS